MRALSFRRRSASSNTNNTNYYVLGLCATAVAVTLLLALQPHHLSVFSHASSSSARRRLHGGRIVSLYPLAIIRPRNRYSYSDGVDEAHGAVFHTELVQRFNLTELPTTDSLADLTAALQRMERGGISMVVFSSPWDWFQPREGDTRFNYLDALVGTACQNTNMKVALILDMVRAPAWVFERWPDAKAMDSHGREYPLLSWFHSEAQQLSVQVLVDVVSHLTGLHAGCLTAVQPVYNNQYEARYTQEHDCYQDYSGPAVTAFRRWLQARQPQLAELNLRWLTSYSAWGEVQPPALEAGSFLGMDVSPRYWDFIKFREEYGAKVLNRACAAVQASGLRCFHHVAPFLSVLDAVYGATMFKHIAASEHTDFVIMDSNFYTSYGTPMNPERLRLHVAAARSYGKPVYFEAAVERSPSLELLAAGFRHAAEGGASGVGISNWLGRYDMDEMMHDVLHPTLPYCKVKEVVGLFIHLDSCATFHGLQWGWSRKDPIEDFVQDLADALTDDCSSAVEVYLELERFYDALPGFDRVIFVEPLVLMGGAELDMYGMVKSYMRSVPHQVLQLPINRTGGVKMTVLQEL